MKKSVMLAVMGVALAATSTSYGQGHIVIGNYQTGYNPVVWGGGTPRDGLGILSSEGVTLTLWYAEGASAVEGDLIAGPTLVWDLVNEGNGYPGYYSFTEIVLPEWQPGDVYTFQIRASGDSIFGPIDENLSRSVLWQESNINAITFPPIPANQSVQSIGFTVIVPEPSTFALAGLSAAAMMIFRRRRS